MKNTELTGHQIRDFVWNARSLVELNLGQIAQRKWYDTHKGTAQEDDAFFDSATGVFMKRSFMEEIEAEGRDSKVVLAAQESAFDDQMKAWLDEGVVDGEINEHERAEISHEWERQSEANTRKMDALAIQIKVFIEADNRVKS